MERLFGAPTPVDAAPPARADRERLRLVGVIAPRLAILEIDGRAARTWLVGSTITDGVVLLSLGKRDAQFGPAGGPTAFVLELPAFDGERSAPVPAQVSEPTPPEPTIAHEHRRSGPRHVGRSHSTRRHGGASVEEPVDADTDDFPS